MVNMYLAPRGIQHLSVSFPQTQKEEEAAPKSVDVQPSSEGEKAVDVQQDNVNKEITLQPKEDG